jgi:hypothetical protein
MPRHRQFRRVRRCRALRSTTVLFSVAPSHSPTGTFVPSAVIARATTQHRSAGCSPSTISTLMSNVDRSLDSNSARAVRVQATNRRETADLLVPAAAAITSAPTGSPVPTCRRVATPASIRCITTRPNRSSAANSRQARSRTSGEAAERTRRRARSRTRPSRRAGTPRTVPASIAARQIRMSRRPRILPDSVGWRIRWKRQRYPARRSRPAGVGAAHH